MKEDVSSMNVLHTLFLDFLIYLPTCINVMLDSCKYFVCFCLPLIITLLRRRYYIIVEVCKMRGNVYFKNVYDVRPGT